jgi:hypothetical protein
MRFTWLGSKALILKSRKELFTSLVSAAVVAAAGFAIGSASLASTQDLSRPSSTTEAAFLKENDAAMTKMMNDMAHTGALGTRRPPKPSYAMRESWLRTGLGPIGWR